MSFSSITSKSSAVFSCRHVAENESTVQVYYKATDYLEDQVLVSGFAAGGLSEVPREQFRTCSLATMLTQELGTFGLRPEVSCTLFWHALQI